MHRTANRLGTILGVVLLVATRGEDNQQAKEAAQPDGAHPAAAPSAPAYPNDWPDAFGFGREATEVEIAAWDIDIMPDGTGLRREIL